MAKLTAAARRKLKPSQFALPGGHYPVEDRAHAIAAKGRAKEFATPEQLKIIDAKANRVLGKTSAKKAKKK